MAVTIVGAIDQDAVHAHLVGEEYCDSNAHRRLKPTLRHVHVTGEQLSDISRPLLTPEHIQWVHLTPNSERGDSHAILLDADRRAGRRITQSPARKVDAR